MHEQRERVLSLSLSLSRSLLIYFLLKKTDPAWKHFVDLFGPDDVRIKFGFFIDRSFAEKNKSDIIDPSLIEVFSQITHTWANDVP